VLLTIIWLIIIGLIAGALARFLVPGRDPMGFVGTAVLGIIGSFVGGSLWALITEGSLELRTASWIGSIIGAIIALLIYRAVASKDRTTARR
jgi:uncharacterized membrane protein YeaQ/YmgE (transglycosylase-associated protein family)